MNIDKQEVRDYLLGTLPEERRAELDEKILSDPDIYEELLLCEEELIDQYVAGGLSTSEQYQFENYFLITDERRQSVSFSRLFQRYVDSHPHLAPSQSISAAVGQRGKASHPKRSFRAYCVPFLGAIITSIVVIFVCWFAFRTPAESAAVNSVHHSIVITLAPGSIRSERAAPRLKVPPQGVDVKLELEVPNTGFRNFKLQLFRENRPLNTTAQLGVEPNGVQSVVPLMIPGEILSPGDYQVRLSGVRDSGQDEFIDNYSFRVTD